MDKNYRYAVIGAGNGGKAMAAYLALLGVQVTLYNRTASRVEIIQLRGGIDLENPNEPRGFGKLYKVTDNMEEALRDADIVMVIVPSTAHYDVAKAAAPFLRDDHIVILNPGRTGGTLEFRFTLVQENCTTNPIIAEAETFLFASRSEGPSQAKIFRIKEAVPLAALPAMHTAEVLEAIRPVLPQFIDGKNVLQTGLNNMGAIFHPTWLCLMLAGSRLPQAISSFMWMVSLLQLPKFWKCWTANASQLLPRLELGREMRLNGWNWLTMPPAKTFTKLCIIRPDTMESGHLAP